MKVLIIEDENISYRRLYRLLLDIKPDLEIDGPLTSTTEVISKLSEKNDYDLIFSDIRLRDNDVFSSFMKVKPECAVVFTTAYDEYALEAFKNNGIDYLLKPIEKEELVKALEKAEHLYSHGISDKVDSLIKELRKYRERILVWKGDELVPINVKDVSYFYFDQRHVYARLCDGNVSAIPFTMGKLEDELDPKIFFRLNRQYIANIDSITRINLFSHSKLIVRLKGCNELITLSKEKSFELRLWLDR